MPRGIPKTKQAKTDQQGAKPDTPANGITKWKAVQRALAKLGKKAQPSDIRQFVLAEFKLDLPHSLISNYKHTILKKKRARRGAKAGRGGLVHKGQAPAPAGPANGTSAPEITLEDIRAVKALADKIGADKVRALAGVLG
jgi:hypothetical protein